MSIRAAFVVLLAIVCGVSAAMGVYQLRMDGSAQAVSEPETMPVVVAALSVSRGQMITANDVKIHEWPKQMVPEGALMKLEDAVDRAVAIPLFVDEPVVSAKLAPKDAGRGLAALVPNGMRAYTIQTARVAASVAGFVMPGNKVDVLMNLRGNQNDDSGGGSTTTLLQSVEILAVDQRLDAPTDNKVNPKETSSVTLLVTPQQATLLDLGQNLGQLTLSLRNPEDSGQAAASPATLADIRFRQEKPAPVAQAIPAALLEPVPPKEPEVQQIVTLRGNHRGLVTIRSAQ